MASAQALQRIFSMLSPSPFLSLNLAFAGCSWVSGHQLPFALSLLHLLMHCCFPAVPPLLSPPYFPCLSAASGQRAAFCLPLGSGGGPGIVRSHPKGVASTAGCTKVEHLKDAAGSSLKAAMPYREPGRGSCPGQSFHVGDACGR